jgi:hypothetical protein
VFKVGKDRVQRIWRQERLKVAQRQRPRRRLWLNDGSCVRLRPAHINHVWSYDHVWSYNFMAAMTHDGRSLRLLILLDEFSREVSCDACGTALRRIRGDRDLGRSYEATWRARAYSLGQWAGVPGHGAAAMLAQVGCATLYIEPGSAWEKGYGESFNGRLRDESSMARSSTHSGEAQIVIENWRVE